MPLKDPQIPSRRDRAIAHAQRELALHNPGLYSSTLSYGAVDIDPDHLAVWVLLSGQPEDLPEWYFPGTVSADSRQYSPALLTAIDAMRDIVVTCFAQEDWPNIERLRVGFDSEVRVSAEGGWQYFK